MWCAMESSCDCLVSISSVRPLFQDLSPSEEVVEFYTPEKGAVLGSCGGLYTEYTHVGW